MSKALYQTLGRRYRCRVMSPHPISRKSGLSPPNSPIHRPIVHSTNPSTKSLSLARTSGQMTDVTLSDLDSLLTPIWNRDDERSILPLGTRPASQSTCSSVVHWRRLIASAYLEHLDLH